MTNKILENYQIKITKYIDGNMLKIILVEAELAEMSLNSMVSMRIKFLFYQLKKIVIF